MFIEANIIEGILTYVKLNNIAHEKEKCLRVDNTFNEVLTINYTLTRDIDCGALLRSCCIDLFKLRTDCRIRKELRSENHQIS